MIYRVDYVVGSDSRWADCRSAAESADFIGSRLIQGKTAVQISVRRIDKTTILDVSGDIDLSCSPEVRKALLHESRNNRIPRVVVNLN